jgi:uncharacterized phage-associated protein
MVMSGMYDVRAIANWVLDKAEARHVCLSNMAINKLVYFIVERTITDRGRLVTDAKIEAWQHGPVFREIYHAFSSFADGEISGRATKFDVKSRSMIVARADFSKDDEELFEGTLDQYINLSASQLRALSHREGGPWHRVWWHEAKLNPGMEISVDTILSAHSSEKVQ